MAEAAESHTRLRSPWVHVARSVWAILALLNIGFFIASIPKLVRELNSLEGNTVGGLGMDANMIRAGLDALQISTSLYATYVMTVLFALAICCVTLALILVLRKSDELLVLLISLSTVAFGTGYIYIGSFPAPDLWPPPLNIVVKFLAYFTGGIAYLVFILLFPDGRFRPRWTRWLAILVLLFGLYLILDLQDNVFVSATTGLTPIGLGLILIMLPAVVAAQIYRYSRLSSPMERQQTKWAVFGFGVALLGLIIVSIPRWPGGALIQTGPSAVIYTLTAFTFTGLCALTGLAFLGIAILRYRLWDIDIIIRRTLIYATLSVALAAVYFLSVALIQGLIPSQSQIVTVFSTLIVAALFTPLRRRVQRQIDRSFYRRHYDLERTLEGFGSQVRDEVDLDRISEALIRTVGDVIQPREVSLWLKDRSGIEAAIPRRFPDGERTRGA